MSKGTMRAHRTGKYKQRPVKRSELKDPKRGYSRDNFRQVHKDLLDPDFWL